jgi:hypothetical protein
MLILWWLQERTWRFAELQPADTRDHREDADAAIAGA